MKKKIPSDIAGTNCFKMKQQLAKRVEDERSERFKGEATFFSGDPAVRDRMKIAVAVEHLRDARGELLIVRRHLKAKMKGERRGILADHGEAGAALSKVFAEIAGALDELESLAPP